MYGFLTFVMLFLALCMQEFVPRMGESASFGIVLFFPAWFLCTAVTLSYPLMLGASFFAGLLWDLRYTVDPGLGLGGQPVPGGTPFGFGILLFAFLGHFMHSVRGHYKKRQMGFPIVLVGLGIFLFRLLDYIFLNFKRGSFSFPEIVFREMCATALLSMILAPLIYFVLWWLARTIRGHQFFAYDES